jgi:DNA-binding FadR family transcriptional regulator
MLSNNHTSDQKYDVKLEFSCWISEFFLHISPTTNNEFLYLILIMMWQMFDFFFVLSVMNIQTLEIWI